MKAIIIAVCLSFAVVAFGQAPPRPLPSVQDGVYFASNVHAMTIVELRGGQFRFWFDNDAEDYGRNPPKPKYPVIGKYVTNGGSVTLVHQDVFDPEWRCMTHEGKTTLWRPGALSHVDKTGKIDPYGVLLPTSRSPDQLWRGWERDHSNGEALVHIRSGVANPISYALYRAAPPKGRLPDATTCDLLLMVRNMGNRPLRLHQLLLSDFTLTDAKTGGPVVLTLVGKPAPVGFAQSTVIQLTAKWWTDRPMPERGVLTIKGDYFMLPQDLTFADIPLQAPRDKK